MAILFLSPSDSPAEWLPELHRQLPDREVRVWPDIGDPDDIDYAMIWRPPAGVLKQLPNLKVMLSLGAGVDGVLSDPELPDLPLVRMVEPGLTEGMTEFVVLQVLHWHRQMEAYRAQQRDGVWRQLPQKLARERRVGILGLGVLGADAARVLTEIRFDVAGWSRSARELPGLTCFHGAAGLAAFLAQTEILVCLLPLTEETRGFLCAELFAQLPRGAHLINVGRGDHLVEADLRRALDDGTLGAATLDALAQEPLPAEHPFWRDPRIVITPHIATRTDPASIACQTLANLVLVRSGRAAAAAVDLSRGY
jgi:glyoxylate/hydroxypyruvate reductase A